MLFQKKGRLHAFYYFTDYQELNWLCGKGCHEFGKFGWKPEDTADPQVAGNFEKIKIEMAQLKQENHAGIFNWYPGSKLIRLRD